MMRPSAASSQVADCLAAWPSRVSPSAADRKCAAAASDVARIERAWLDAYHAADAEPLRPQALASVAPERLADITLTPHPATRIVRSRFPAVAIFAANRSDDWVGRIEASDPEDALVTRPRLEVVVRRLPPGGAAFLTSLIAGEAFGVAAAMALADHPAFDLPANIVGMLEAGAVTAIGLRSDTDGS